VGKCKGREEARMLQTFKTSSSSRVERSRQWCAMTQAQHVEFGDDRQASLRGDSFGRLAVCIASMGSHRVVQSCQDASRSREPLLKFLFQEEGSTTIHQGDRSNSLNPGQWCAIRKDLPFVVDAPARSRQLAITLPGAMLPAQRRGVDWWRQPRGFLRGPGQILHASASAALLNGAGLSSGDRLLIGQQLAALVEMTIRVDSPLMLPDIREDRRQSILDFIDRNLADPDLGIAGLAQAFGLSSRTIHKLFEGEAQTVARIIWDRRLERCREEMTDPALATRSITQIAHHWGFSDSQHFSRAFKQRFGLTPRDYRGLHAVH
jgi:AraC-like DNA-binding protein